MRRFLPLAAGLVALLASSLVACAADESDSRTAATSLASYAAVTAEDRDVLQGLVDAGADLSDEREVRHYLYFDDEQSARVAAREAATADWTTTVLEPAADISEWSVEAVAERVLTPEEVSRSTGFFENSEPVNLFGADDLNYF